MSRRGHGPDVAGAVAAARDKASPSALLARCRGPPSEQQRGAGVAGREDSFNQTPSCILYIFGVDILVISSMFRYLSFEKKVVHFFCIKVNCQL